jgi:hypothetical protein
MELAAWCGMEEGMTGARQVACIGDARSLTSEIDPKEPGQGKPCAGKPPARFDEGA